MTRDENHTAGSSDRAARPETKSAEGGDGSRMIDLPLRSERGGGAEDGARRPARGAEGMAAGTEIPAARGAEAGPPTSPRAQKAGFGVAIRWLLPSLFIAVLAWWLFWPAPPRIVSSEQSLVFERTRVGRSGEAASVSLSNFGERRLRIEDLVIVGDAAADFAVEDETCLGTLVSSGESCDVAVAFRPIEAGERRAALQVQGNVRGGDFSVPLGGSAVAPEVGLAPERVDFGAVQVDGQRASVELTISNVGTATLELGRIVFQGPQANEFDRDRRCPDTSLEPGEACTMRVRFTPLASGSRIAEMILQTDAPSSPSRLPLRGGGVWDGPPLDVEPSRLEFGEQRVGRRSAPGRLRFMNRTSASVEVGELLISPERMPFSITGDGCGGRLLISGESCELLLAVEPSEEGGLAADLEMRFSEAGSLRVPLAARGVEPRLELSAGSIDFGSLRSGFESGAESVELENTGSATLKIEGARIVGDQAGDFVIRSSCVGKDLAAGESCTMGVAFRPRAMGTRRAEVEVTPSEGLEPLRLALSGVGTVAGLALERSSLSWAPLQLGQSGSQPLGFSNSGTARLQVRGLRIVGEGRDDFAVSRIGCALDAGLGEGERCELSIRFSPSADGNRVATLEIDHNGPDSPGAVGLSGRGEPPRPLFRASPREFAFGTVRVGGRSDIATLVVGNAGGAWMPLRGITLAGRNATDFELVAGTCDGISALAPGGECAVGVRFVPTGPGRREGVLEVRHGAGGGPALLPVAGTGG